MAVARPRFRGTSHVVATGVGALAALALIRRAPTDAHRAAAAGYGASMTGMFAVSAAYHRGRWSVAARRRMKAADHSMIFVFVVGSYVPLAVLVLDRRGRVLFLGSLAVAAAVGAGAKLRGLDRAGGPADVLYGVTAWWGLWIAVPAVRALSPLDVALALVGLLSYSLAAGLLAVRWYDPAPVTFGYHEVAHVAALLGTACHYVLYWRAYR